MHKNENRPGYKKTKVGWIPEGWKVSTFGDEFEIQLGKMLDQKATAGDAHQPYLANINVRWGSFDLSNARTMSFSEKDKKRFSLKRGDLLVCEGGEIGRCAIWQEELTPCYFQKALHRLRPLNKNVDVHFTMHFLHEAFTSPRIKGLIGETSIAHFTRERFFSFPISKPALPEQEAIAEVLECWDRGIRNLELKIVKKRRIKKGLMQRLLAGTLRLPGFGAECRISNSECRIPKGWKIVKLGKISAIRKGQQLSRIDQTETGEYPVLNGGIEPLGFTDSWNTEKNTITISEGGNSCGFVNFNTEKFWCGGHCYALEEDESKAAKPYLFQFLKHKQTPIMRLRVGSGLPNIQKKALEHFEVALPPLEEQRAIAEVLAAADGEIEALERKLALWKEQKKFLLQNLVTGTIRLPAFVKE